MLTIRAMSDGRGYSSKHLEHGDYYAEGEHVVGLWQGRGAELLGLEGEVESKDFEALRQACHPETGEFLRQRHSSDRIAADGATQSHGRNLYDFTISAPKSVSIMGTLGGDKRLIEAHQNAVKETLRELEAHAEARVRRGGAQDDRVTGNLVLAVYHHDTSRELDPQLHTHAVAANLTYDGAEGRWKALQASDIYECRAYFTEVYRNSLAHQVRQLGYEIENHQDRRGRDLGFEIRGLPKEILDKYSQRSQQRDEAIDRFTAANGRRPTNNEVSVLVRESRADKLIEISTDEVHARQESRLLPAERQLLTDLQLNGHGETIGFDSAERFLIYAEDHIFERVSVCHDHEVLTEALQHGRGGISHDDLRGHLSLQESTGAILRDRDEIATADSLKRERGIINSVNRGIDEFDRLGGDSEFIVSDRLNPEQKNAVEFVLNSHDRAVNISGAAGTGKTAILQELHRGLDEADRESLAVAPTVSAVEELQKVGFKDATTIERLLLDQSIQEKMDGKVLIVDEAGMISGRQMQELLELSETRSVRIVFSGDTSQIQSVEAGDALRILEKESGLKSVSLTKIQRQTSEDYREAIQELRRNPEAGFEKLDSIGAVQEVPYAERAQAIAETYASSSSQGHSTLVVCATHEEIDRVTEEIRFSRKQAGELGEPIQLTRDVSMNWTTAQKAEMKNFHPGQQLRFHREVKGIAKNETVEVVRLEDKRLIVRHENGQGSAVTARHAKSFDIIERKSIEVAAGDKLLLTANRRGQGLHTTNGEIVTVSRVGRNGEVHLQDGRTLPRDFKQFTHGYAVTAHRSQGKSVDKVIVSADGMKKEPFYVAASRGRESVSVITSNKDELRRSVGSSAARRSASELAQKAEPEYRPSIHRGLEAARKLARRAARYVTSRLRRETPQWELKIKPEIEIERKEIREYDHNISR